MRRRVVVGNQVAWWSIGRPSSLPYYHRENSSPMCCSSTLRPFSSGHYLILSCVVGRVPFRVRWTYLGRRTARQQSITITWCTNLRTDKSFAYVISIRVVSNRPISSSRFVLWSVPASRSSLPMSVATLLIHDVIIQLVGIVGSR